MICKRCKCFFADEDICRRCVHRQPFNEPHALRFSDWELRAKWAEILSLYGRTTMREIEADTGIRQRTIYRWLRKTRDPGDRPWESL